MAKTLSNNGIVLNQIIYPQQVSQSIDALTGADDYDITVSGSFTVTGSTLIDGNVTVDGAITMEGNVVAPNLTDTAQSNVVTYNPINGQFYYTASNAISPATASNSVSASYAATASYVQNAQTASYVLNAVSASYAATASYVENAQTASYVENAQTASYYDETDPVFVSKSASLATTGSNIFSGSQTISGSINQQGTFYPDVIDWISSSIQYTTGSYVLTTTTDGVTTYANYQDVATRLGDYLVTTTSFNSYTGSNTSQFAGTASYATSASYAVSSSAADSAISASYSTTASFAQNATSASYAVSASHANSSNTASYALTASYLEGYISPFPFTGSAQITGSLGVTGSATVNGDLVVNGTASFNVFHTIYNSSSIIYASGSTKFGDTSDDTHQFTGSLYVSGSVTADTFTGTASYATQAATASFVTLAQTASFVTLAQTASYVNQAVSASYATTASYVENAQTASYVATASYSNNSLSSSYALTASHVTGIVAAFPYTGSAQITGSLGVTGSVDIYNSGSTVLSVNGSTGALITVTDTNSGALLTVATGSTNILVVDSSLVTTITGSLDVQNGVTASLFGTASWAQNSTTASFATTAQTASYVAQAVSASFATTASYAVSASYEINYETSSSYAETASIATTASYAVNGGVTQLFAGPNITLSPTTGVGQVTISSTGAGTYYNTSTGSYGSFYDTTSQLNPVANIPRSMSLNTTDITNGVSISGSSSPFNTYLKIENAGVYNIQFSAQLYKSDSGTDFIDIWLRRNGVDLMDSATNVALIGNHDRQVAAWNWFATAGAGDYYQIMWASADTDVQLLAEPATGVHPGIPSVIATVNRIDTFLSNTGSFSGSFNGVLNGTASYATQAATASFVTTAQTASYVLNAVSASFASTASYVNQLNQTVNISGSLNTTGSVTIYKSGSSPLVVSGSQGPLFEITDSVSGSLWTIYTGSSPIFDVSSDRTMTLNGSATITGSLTVQNGITGSLFGTASWAQNATTASFVTTAQTASYVLNAISASRAISSSNADVAASIYVTGASEAGVTHHFPMITDVGITPVGTKVLYQSPISINGSNVFINSGAGTINATASYAVKAESATFASTASYVLNAVSASFASTASYVNQLNQTVNISGSLFATGSVDIYKSGSTVFAVSGSNGPLFDVTDVVSGSLFTVWTGSNRILQANSDYTTILGGASSAAALFTTTKNTANSGSTTIYTLPTATYDSIHIDYNIRSGSVARAGNLFAIWSGSSVNQTETSASSFGDTSGFTFGVIVSGSNLALTGSTSTSGWTVKTIIRSI